MVAAAVVASGVIAAGATAAAGSEAAGATQAASNAAINEQQSALSQQAQLSAPYRGVGTDAIGQYEALLGIGPGGTSNPAGIQSALENTPGYQFTQKQGETGILNAASAAGGVGGNTLAALDTYNTGLASGTYQQVLGDYGTAVQTGQAAAAGQAQNVGNAAANIGSTLINQGNNIAGIDANVAAGIGKAFGNTSDNLITQQTIGALKTQGGTPATPPSNDPGPLIDT